MHRRGVCLLSTVFAAVVLPAWVGADASLGELQGAASALHRSTRFALAEMGDPDPPTRLIRLEPVTPDVLRWRAAVVYEKVDRLAFDFAGTRAPLPKGQTRDQTDREALDLLLRSRERFADYLKVHGLEEPDPPAAARHDASAPDAEIVLDRLLESLDETSLALDVLLARKVVPSDVYQQISVALIYASYMSPGMSRQVVSRSARHPHERRAPADVHRLLVEAMDRLVALHDRVGSDTAPPRIVTLDPRVIRPADVFDVATLVVEWARELYLALGKPPIDVQPIDPGPKRPADCYARAALLLEVVDATAVAIESSSKDPIASRGPSP